MIDIEKIYEESYKHYNKAKKSLPIDFEKRAIFENASALSDVVPGYSAEKLDFGSYDNDKFAVVFIDIRQSTNRAQIIGSEKTFLSMHAFFSPILQVVEHYKGVVIDFMGDGLMAFFGGDSSELTKDESIKNAGLCGRDMLLVISEVTNKILENDGIVWGLSCGVGVAYGDVIITKIGTNETFDVKAFGDCINDASKFSKGDNRVKVSKYIRNHWPAGKNGKISFSDDGEGYILHHV
ncbi:adenylate/guanylate cyclase domain-containing protein [Anoxybacterium hadale]|uniref:Adenylate/guanylate cyclase domain-containing protein n=1 Tax=Anoxybacterium hadale TaxID=3408580 RepID=A0ACD1ABN1_9FIRM|nr:adenylate/guanylate cyclase domain-containing protein [Clostridiales bacterium]